MKAALIVVDVQNDFCEGGSLPVQGGAETATKIHEFIKDKYTLYDLIVFTKDWHYEPGEHWSDNPDFKDSWPQHCKAGSPGAEFHPNLGASYLIGVLDPIAEKEIRIFRKGQHGAAYSGFEGYNINNTDLVTSMDDHDIEMIDVCGIALDYCVKATAWDAKRLGFQTTVLVDLTAAVAEETRSEALIALEQKGVKLA